MKSSRMFASAVVVLLNVGLCAVAVAQNGATPQEVVAKVKEAAGALSKTGDLSQFDQKQGPWVWKDTYVFIQDCNKKVMAAHPIKPEMIGKGLDTVMDANPGRRFMPIRGPGARRSRLQLLVFGTNIIGRSRERKKRPVRLRIISQLRGRLTSSRLEFMTTRPAWRRFPR